MSSRSLSLLILSWATPKNNSLPSLDQSTTTYASASSTRDGKSSLINQELIIAKSSRTTDMIYQDGVALDLFPQSNAQTAYYIFYTWNLSYDRFDWLYDIFHIDIFLPKV